MCFRFIFSGHVKHSNLIDVIRLVQKYIKGMKESNKLLDLTSAAGSDEIEPTKAVANQTALYYDVSLSP